MSKINYQALREKAEKATCGVWSLEYGEERFDADDALIHREVAGYIPICRIEGAHPESGFDEDFQMEQQANAEFIAAANPATVLELLGELETAENNLIDSECHVAELEEALRDKQALLEASEKRIAELEAEPVSQAYNLAELIEGMEVSIDVSTCDADLGNRYFGTVTEALELDTAKNGYILLVQDAEPNFDVNGNYPVTPDGWISCSERMPDDGQHVIILCDGAFVLYAQYRDGEFFDIVRNGDEFFETQSRNVTDWMQLPEPPL
ncbi:TPA: ead/Ea22-like family protein [Escherichia coli]|nr:ead/Ea22-like family protein [Escherichia coli]WDN85806.1 ead/Ea22-like family protein [Escherichia coli]HBU5945666.1 ead/Ea22-like family protein [Escherichia coli]